MRALLLLSMVSLLSGCQWLALATASKVEAEAKPNGDINVGLITGSEQLSSLDESIRKICSIDGMQKSAAIAAPIAGKLVFDAIGKYAESYVEGIKKKSTRTYSTRYVTNSDLLKQVNCFTVRRDGLFLIAQINKGDNAYSFRPIYVLLDKSYALTECTENCSSAGAKKGDVGITIALAQSAIVPGVADVYELRSMGTAVMSVPKVTLHKPQSPRTLYSEILPFPPSDSVVQLSIGITETGSLPGDFDAAIEEAKAVSGALGTWGVEEVKAHYAK